MCLYSHFMVFGIEQVTVWFIYRLFNAPEWQFKYRADFDV